MNVPRLTAIVGTGFNRIELIILNSDSDICRIDLTDEAKRNKVLGVTRKQHLADLFEQFS